ncbi:MAG: preprotein translocase subunit SecE [Myxococcota bacterium]
MTKQRYVILVFVVAAILIGLTLQSAFVSLFLQMSWNDNVWGGVVNTSTALALLGGATSFFALVRTRTAVAFTSEVVGELLRVTWPTRDETMRASTTVVLTTLFTAALLAVYDFTWKSLADLFLFPQ